jgi:low molecular weight protein-tyrosine phosphatase
VVEVVFVCWGNICRSPMAERVAQGWAAREGLHGVRFSSAGTSREELGEPIDGRARRVLERSGYSTGGHRAHQITAAEIREADLVIAMEDLHLSRMRRLVPDADNLALLSDFDPDAAPGSGVPDPWYGSPDGFNGTLAAIEAAMPGVLDRVRELAAARR